MITIIASKLDYICNELLSRNEGHAYEIFLLGLNQVAPSLVWTFEVGIHTPLIGILRQENTCLNLIWILRLEDTDLIWVIHSAGNLRRIWKKEDIATCLLAFISNPILYLALEPSSLSF